MQDKYMTIAINEAKKALKTNDVPVGAVIVKNNKIISKDNNKRIKNKKVINHAEINCILKANKKLKNWRLDNCDLYVTLKPCAMCESIIRESRIQNVYYLIDSNNKVGYKKTKIMNINTSKKIKDEYKEILNLFFKKMR